MARAKRYLKYPKRGPANRVTIYLGRNIHAWLKIKAATTDYTVSGWVNDILARELAKESGAAAAIRNEEAKADVELEDILRRLRES